MPCYIFMRLPFNVLISEQYDSRRMRMSGGDLLERHMAWVEQDKLEVSEKIGRAHV